MKYRLPVLLLLAAALVAAAFAGATAARADVVEPDSYVHQSQPADYTIDGQCVTVANPVAQRILNHFAEAGGYWAFPNGIPFPDQTPSHFAIAYFHLVWHTVTVGCVTPGPAPGAPSKNWYWYGSDGQSDALMALTDAEAKALGAKPACAVKGVQAHDPNALMPNVVIYDKPGYAAGGGQVYTLFGCGSAYLNGLKDTGWVITDGNKPTQGLKPGPGVYAIYA